MYYVKNKWIKMILQNKKSDQFIRSDFFDYIKNVPDNTFDLIIADPPYFRIRGDFVYLW